jgi:hypothetical protein
MGESSSVCNWRGAGRAEPRAVGRPARARTSVSGYAPRAKGVTLPVTPSPGRVAGCGVPLARRAAWVMWLC